MKKIICLFLALVMMLSLSSCFLMNDEDTQDDIDAAIKEAEDIFDDASDKKVRYKTKIAKDDGVEYFHVKATFSEKEFTSVGQMKVYADEIINGPVAKAEKVLKPVDLEIRVLCCDAKGNQCFYIVNGEIRSVSDDGGIGEVEKNPSESGLYYEGQEFTFLVVEYDPTFYSYNGGYIDSESITGLIIDDKVYERNLAVEDQFGIDVKTISSTGNSVAEVVSQYNLAGDFCYDVIYGAGSQLGACITAGLLKDFNELEGVDYTDAHWRPSTIEDLAIGGKQFISACAITMSPLSGADCIYYNERIAEDFNVASEFGNPYDMVLDGTWTYDTMLRMIQAVSRDLDGDSRITKNDIYGMIGGSARGVLEGCGMFYTKETEGFLELSFYNEKTLSVISNIYDVLSNSNYVKSYDELIEGADATGYDDVWQYARSHFAFGHSLFMSATLDYMREESINNMEDVAWILPAPKYDSAQEQYVSTVSNSSFLFALPASYNSLYGDSGPVRTGAILDYMAKTSYELLLPAYKQTIIATAISDQEQQSEIIDIIFSSVRFESADVFALTKTVETVDAICSNPATAASAYRRNIVIAQKELNEFCKAVMSLG